MGHPAAKEQLSGSVALLLYKVLEFPLALLLQQVVQGLGLCFGLLLKNGTIGPENAFHGGKVHRVHIAGALAHPFAERNSNGGCPTPVAFCATGWECAAILVSPRAIMMVGTAELTAQYGY